MAIPGGPNISITGLDFYFDVDNIDDSYLGEPTTNLLPNASINGRFNIGNSWGTYNTNQYNSNQYFSIGVIDNITDNIVTLSTVSRTLRTYDALRPQTTGGGVVSGSNYFIKMISSNQFTIHQYNSNQDGSQGYINTSTGNHKVYDSIELDQRISITSENFPTMWWGPPHLPNTCHVKEIVFGGGYVKGTNCMRIHVTRTTGVDGGMAYNVNTPITINDVVTVSFHVKGYGQGIGASCTWRGWFPTPDTYIVRTFIPTGDWVRLEYTFTAPSNNNMVQYWFLPARSLKYYVDISDVQVEINKGHATKFTTGSRSNTQSIKDIITNNFLNVSAVSFDSSSTPVFDGTDDILDTGLYTGRNPSTEPFSVEAWVYTQNTTSQQMWVDASGNGNNQRFYSSLCTPTRPLNFGVASLGWVSGVSDSTGWFHQCIVMDGNTARAYCNGVEVGNRPYSSYSIVGPLKIGRSGYSWDGYVKLFKVYNRSLTPEEVLQNYNATKSRFGLQ